MGLQTAKIAEDPSTKTCDFRASDGKDVYWVEVKERTGDERLAQAFIGKDVSLIEKPLGYDPRTDSILRSAVKQLDSLASPQEPGLTIVWLEMHSPFENGLHSEQAIATVFGAAEILDTGHSQPKACYFFGESAFFRFKQLDAVVVDEPSGPLLCVNPYAHRRERFRQSKFFEFFRTRAVLDAAEEELTGRAYSAFGCDLDRKDERGMLDFVKARYSLKSPSIIRLRDAMAGGTYRAEIEARRQRRNPTPKS
jgi:hypothetical protein